MAFIQNLLKPKETPAQILKQTLRNLDNIAIENVLHTHKPYYCNEVAKKIFSMLEIQANQRLAPEWAEALKDLQDVTVNYWWLTEPGLQKLCVKYGVSINLMTYNKLTADVD